MADSVLLNKAATMERCVARARAEYAKNPATFATDFTRQPGPGGALKTHGGFS